jgi:hypothetical protein
MPSTNERRRTTRLAFYVAFGVLVATVWEVQRHMNAAAFPPNSVISSESNVTDWQRMSVSAVSETSRLLTTLATALLGGIGLLLGNRDQHRPKPRHLWSALLAAMAAGVSLYFGFVIHSYLVGMFSYETFSAYVLKYPAYCQFYALLGGAFFLADFAFHDLSAEN